MRGCTFVSDGTVGTRKVRAGETVVLPEAFVRSLIRRGVAVEPLPDGALSQPPGESPDAPPPSDLSSPSGAVNERITKPAVNMTRKALKKLLRGK